MILPKLLRKTTTGQVFAYTAALAELSDMVAVWPDGVNPNVDLPRATGLQAEGSQQNQLRAAIAKQSQAAQESDKRITELMDENSRLNEEISKLNQLIRNLSGETVGTTKAAMIDPERMAKIIEGAKSIKEAGDQNNFTGSGKIRIEPLEAASGIKDITAGERDAAMENIEK